MPGRHALVIFARAPERGRVKTRLAAELGPDAALAIYRDLGRRVVQHARTTACALHVAVTPDHGAPLVREWLGRPLRCVPQGPGDLGSRLARVTGALCVPPARGVIVIGTDCPDVDASLVHAACRALERTDVVLGPTHDGGYYLVGLRRPAPALFQHIPWSTGDTLCATLQRARAAGLGVVLLPVRGDIDTAADWRAWLARRGAADPACADAARADAASH